ncbi:putative DnaA recombination protein [Aeromonas phage 2_D05]|uniref:Putative DnaA recombination protein n=1 Tax=Aeromonas phage 2_D05 TaxID=2588098 RepID=A0A4Y5TXT9_9CAUD|nr:putative DnaA recombination protein [Aeromonas phage 2_D05]QDB73855.1 putative DnaA recombination protein [Aeromonas phage 2_D05]
MPSKLDDRVKKVIDLLNSMTGSKYKASTKSHAGNISGRLNDGHSVDDLMAVVRFKVGEWLHDPKMAQYLRPETLFQAGKFNGYLTAAKATQGPLAGLSAISRKNAQNLAGDW